MAARLQSSGGLLNLLQYFVSISRLHCSFRRSRPGSSKLVLASAAALTV
jgi:hypothetical protein